MSFRKPAKGYFFEDFRLQQMLKHGVPRTITESDATLYLALTGSRFPLFCSQTIAQTSGFEKTPLDNLLVFHIAFGKTVNDISLNAVANLGYAEVIFHQPTFAGDTLKVESEVIGLKENSNRKTGVVYVHSVASNQRQEIVLDWKRWVMVRKEDQTAKISRQLIPQTLPLVSPSTQMTLEPQSFVEWQDSDSDYQAKFEDLKIGDAISHNNGMTINDSDHSLATRLYQNNARVHFDQTMMEQSANGKRLVYGGHIISICRSLSYSGLGNAFWISAINAGTHSNPSYAGDTIYCQSRILDKQIVGSRKDLGLVRIQMLGLKNNTAEQIDGYFEEHKGRKKYHPNVVLDLDYWALTLR